MSMRLGRLRRGVATAACAGLTLLFGPAVGAFADDVAGAARVIDGDTIEIGETRVRLEGIDAPETKQTCRDARGRKWACGTSAAHHLDRLIDDKPVRCSSHGLDDYGRSLAYCTAADGRELNRQMVREGQAWAFVKYSTRYVAEEREARAARLGVFGADNTPPWTFREQGWSDAAQAAPVVNGRACPIKGNISRGGEKIYHAPWQRDYNRTKIDEKAGERWFCDEGEALKAGWRPAGHRS
jgi:endonuclease YncB( thermonuclease family)